VKTRIRFLLFAVLAVSLIVALDKATIGLLDKEHHLASSATEISDKQNKPGKPTIRKITPPSKQTWVIPTYPVGNLPVEKKVAKSKEKEPIKKVVRIEKQKKKRISNKPRQSTPKKIAPKRDGDFPVLEVGYEAIGFADYLDAIERVGHFFLISNTENGTEIGSEISLKSRIVYKHRIDLSNLAIRRPHLVSDSMIRDRLAGFSLPDDVQTDSIILVFSKPFDDLLWDTIEGALSKRNLFLNQVSRIDGGYVKEREEIFLMIRSAEVRNTGEEVHLDRRLRITLG
jgi:hypothetical protein